MRLAVLESAVILAWIVILLLSFTMAGMVRQLHALTTQGAGGRVVSWAAAVGHPAPASLGHPYSRQRPTVVVFASSDCATCEQVVRALPELASERPGSVEFVVAYRAGAFELDHRGVTVRTDQAGVFGDFHVPALPFAVVVDVSGRIAQAEPLGSLADLQLLAGKASVAVDQAPSHVHG
jgi:hypothetical protein